MLIADCDASGLAYRFELRPNRSLSNRGMLWFLVAVGALALFIGLRFALLGAWIVLPLAALEIVGLGIAFALVARAARQREIIDIDEDELRVIREDGRQRQEWRFHAYWVQILLQPDPANWYPTRLFLRSHGRQLEIGRSLTDQERQQLTDELKRRLAGPPGPGVHEHKPNQINH